MLAQTKMKTVISMCGGTRTTIDVKSISNYCECEGLPADGFEFLCTICLTLAPLCVTLLHSFRNGYQIDFSPLYVNRTNWLRANRLMWNISSESARRETSSYLISWTINCERKTFIEILCCFKQALISKMAFILDIVCHNFAGNAKSYIIRFVNIVSKLGHKMLSFLVISLLTISHSFMQKWIQIVVRK